MLYIGEKVGTGRARKIDIALDPLEGTTITAKGGANALAVHRAWPSTAASSTRPTSTWTRSRSAAACPTASSISTRPPADNLDEPGAGQEGRGRRPRRLHPRPAAPRRADRQGARGRRPHHADRRRRRRRRHRDLASRRPASTSTWARAARRRACWRRRRCAASAARCRAGCCSATTTSAAARARCGITDLNRKYELLDLAQGDVMFAATGVTNGTHAARRAPLRRRRGHPFGGDALEDRHGALSSRRSTISRRKTGFEPVDESAGDSGGGAGAAAEVEQGEGPRLAVVEVLRGVFGPARELGDRSPSGSPSAPESSRSTWQPRGESPHAP